MTELRAVSTTEAQPSVSAEVHRRAMRLHPAGVTVITLDDPDGPVGFTASSPSSLSSEPALVSFNVGISSSSLAAVLDARTAVIHLLGEGDEALALRFAGPSHLRFADTSLWTRAETGEPLLHGGRARLRVAIDRLVPAGDHVLVIARLLDAWFDDHPSDPLVIVDGGLRAVPPSSTD
ncbi:flavin reductase family protein [Dietzia sp. UBA5065]|uniref:flavin reductase family protein n=1 Tax=Dietzia sp. UBA5065 TaxID=1946422 RepID=UPI0025C13C56|nr:flavin reductase family protein [Dietzia sp. UBA5065]